MSAITAPVILDSTGKQIVEKLHTQNLLLDILAGATLEHTQNLEEIANIVRSGDADKIFNIGDQIIVPWTDPVADKTWSMPFDVVHFGNVTLEDQESVPGMFLQAHYAHPFGVQFSHERAFLKCPSGLAAGKYKFAFEANYGTVITAGDVVCFELTAAVPENGRIAGCYGAPDKAKSTWKIYSYAADGATLNEAAITPYFTADGTETDLGTMKTDARNGDLNAAQEMAYGYNNYKASAIRQYLNSAAGANAWWTPSDAFDIVPNEITKAGFLAGFQNDFLAAIKPVKVSQAQNTKTDDGTTQDMYDRVFLPSLQEMHIVPQVADAEGVIWEYWKRVSGSSTPLATGGTYPQMRTFGLDNKNNAQSVRLRSAYRGHAGGTWYVTSSGAVSNYLYAYYANRFAPAVVIC